MAITICSAQSHSPTLPTVSLPQVPTASSYKPFNVLQPSTSFLSSSINTKFDIGLAFDDESAMAAAAEAVALASAAIEAARNASVYKERASELEKCYGDDTNMGVRRKKRRKRRIKGLEMDEKMNGGDVDQVSFRSRKAKSGYLSKREEAEYSLCIREKARLEAVRNRIMEKSDDHEVNLKQWAKEIGIKRRNLDRKLCNDRESRERICRSYKRLVISVATSYQGKGLTLQDLVQEGSIGLLRGAERFDPERGYKLSTYVYWWIKQAIVKAIAIKSRAVRLPGSMCDKLPKIAEASNVLSKRLRRLPTFDEIAENLNMRVSTVRLISERSRPAFSLDGAPVGYDSMKLQEIIAGPDETMPETMMKKQVVKQTIEKLLKTLNKREEHILRLHFGLNGDTPRSFEEIARLVNLSRERVRQINASALLKLQQTGIANDLQLLIL